MFSEANNETVKLYSQALYKGGDELLKAYEYLTKEQMKNNGSPERIWNEYVNNSKSKQAQELAFKRVLTYGWWNAVNHQLPHVNFDGSQNCSVKWKPSIVMKYSKTFINLNVLKD